MKIQKLVKNMQQIQIKIIKQYTNHESTRNPTSTYPKPIQNTVY